MTPQGPCYRKNRPQRGRMFIEWCRQGHNGMLGNFMPQGKNSFICSKLQAFKQIDFQVVWKNYISTYAFIKYF